MYSTLSVMLRKFNNLEKNNYFFHLIMAEISVAKDIFKRKSHKIILRFCDMDIFRITKGMGKPVCVYVS